MDIIKRTGNLVEFDKQKIINAICRAYAELHPNVDSVPEYAFIIADDIEELAKQSKESFTVERIQDLVEDSLMIYDPDVEKAYVRFRYLREIARHTKDTFSSILDLTDFKNQELKDENSNKNAIVASTQRDYMAGEVSKRLTNDYLLPHDISEAHLNGVIHFHDSDYFAQHIHNCCLVNLEDMLQNGTVINKTLIEKPHTFATACNIATQIMAVVASGQYGGQTISLTHLAPFVESSRQKIRQEVMEELATINVSPTVDDINNIVEMRLKEEIKRGVQVLQYQINTLNTSNGQTPFVSIFMYLNEAKNEQEKADLVMIIEEVLKQRIQGTKNEKGVWITPAFPKLLYVLEPDNITPTSKYWWLTELAAKCTAKRMVPDYISEKIMLRDKINANGDGDCYACMGCRSFLTPDRSGNGFDNVAKAKNYDGKPKYYGRFNQGVVTINLPYVACEASSLEEFWDILHDKLELCHRALQIRHKRLKGTVSDISPIHWQYGALARLDKGETIDKLLYGGYSTLSLGYAGLWECVYKLIGKKLTEDEGYELGIKIMEELNAFCKKWKAAENIDYSLYGTPIESTTYKFALALRKKFGIIPGVSDKQYITNSYHIHVTEPIDAFNKLRIEAQFQKLSPGGAISYIETPNMQNNIKAVTQVMQYIYDNIMYAELNTKSDYCQVCGYDGEIQIVKDETTNRWVWECPNCGNRNQDKMNVARRTCGYIGSNFWNQGRTEEILERVVHL